MIMVGVLQSSCAVVVHCMALAVTSRASTMPTDANVTEICPAIRLHHHVPVSDGLDRPKFSVVSRLSSSSSHSVGLQHEWRVEVIEGGRAPEEKAKAVEDALRRLIRQRRADLPSAQQFSDLGVLRIQAVTVSQQRRSLALHHIAQHKGIYKADLHQLTYY